LGGRTPPVPLSVDFAQEFLDQALLLHEPDVLQDVPCLFHEFSDPLSARIAEVQDSDYFLLELVMEVPSLEEFVLGGAGPRR